MVTHHYVAHPSPNRSGCVRCPYPRSAHPEPPPPGVVQRDMPAEHDVLNCAVEGTALDPLPLWSYASQRAWPGGVKLEGRSLRRELCEEVADAIHYAVWEICYHLQPKAQAGDDAAAQRIPSRLGAIRKLIEVWDILHLP
jgi:hypothetical protein